MSGLWMDISILSMKKKYQTPFLEGFPTIKSRLYTAKEPIIIDNVPKKIEENSNIRGGFLTMFG